MNDLHPVYLTVPEVDNIFAMLKSHPEAHLWDQDTFRRLGQPLTLSPELGWEVAFRATEKEPGDDLDPEELLVLNMLRTSPFAMTYERLAQVTYKALGSLESGAMVDRDFESYVMALILKQYVRVVHVDKLPF
jgi:hypothetical protein